MNFINEVVASPFDARDYHIAVTSNEFPSEYYCPILMPIKDQGSYPTCAAHACSTVMEFHHMRQTNEYERFSTEFIYGLREPGYYVGDGMVIRDALKTMNHYGDPYEYDFPGNNDVEKASERVNADIDALKEKGYPHRISSYYRCETHEEIKTALMTHGPVVISMNTYKGAKLVDDIYTWDPNAESGCHAVVIIGWDDRGWLVQNSWGRDYAGDGRFVLPYEFKINEAWGICDDIQDENVKKPNGLEKLFRSLWNRIINLFWEIFKHRK